jgi:glycosyltransferase involved in cell wall biosynthesis
MHLAIISPFPPAITGIGQYGYHVTRALINTGAFSRITVLAGANTNSSIRPNHLGDTELDYCWQPNQVKTWHTILTHLKQLNPDLVWFNLGASIFGKSTMPNLLGMFTPMLTRRMGYPTVVTLHELVALADLRALKAPGGIFAPLGARLLTKAATQADVVCLTMRHYQDWLSTHSVDCIYIPIGAYHEPEFLEETKTPEFLFFTTLAPYKGLEILLTAFDNLRAEFPQINLTIAGVEHARFPNYAHDLKTRFNGKHNIQWIGQVAEENVKGLFRRAQIVVLPYIASTGSSSVLYQAATWGRAIVASDLSENKELARENNLQLQFFENGNALSLQNSLRAMLNSVELRNAQTKHNFNSIQRVRPAIIGQHYMEAFHRALEKNKSQK